MTSSARLAANILVADDDRHVLQAMEVILVREGYNVFLAVDGQEAIEQIKENNLDLVISDYEMPRLNGVELCRRVKQADETKLLPVIIMTGHSPEQERLVALEAGCDEFLAKPVQHAELLARIKSLLRLKALVDAQEDAEVVLFTLARAVEAKDRYTQGHADRVGRYAVSLGRALGMGAEKVELLRKGGILHDIGKLGVPDAILQKEGPLTVEEWEVMRKHPSLGCDICQKLKAMKDVLPLIRHHHERLDGTGYPDGLKSSQLPDVVRVVNVVDIYDALTTRRSYKEAFPADKAFKILWEESERGWWDADVIKAWQELVSKQKVV